MLGSMLDNNWMAGMMMHSVSGTAWGVILWSLVQVVLTPMMGGSFFSMAMGGTRATGGSLIWAPAVRQQPWASAGAPEAGRVRRLKMMLALLTIVCAAGVARANGANDRAIGIGAHTL